MPRKVGSNIFTRWTLKVISNSLPRTVVPGRLAARWRSRCSAINPLHNVVIRSFGRDILWVDGQFRTSSTGCYVAERAFADAHGNALDAAIDAIAEIDAWAKGNTDAVAAQLSPAVGIPAPILAVALKRQTYGVKPLDPAVVAEQQRIADTLHSLGLLPKPVVIADAVRKAGS